MVSFHDRGDSPGKFADLYPMIRHARRTTGFFKIRGVNINHQEFEDFVFDIAEVNDFKAELVTGADGTDRFSLSVEVRPGSEGGTVIELLVQRTKERFEVTPEIEVLEIGTLAKEFESSVKAPRFADRRE